MLSAAKAREVSERSKIQIETDRKRNAAAKRRDDAKREAEHKVWWAAEIQKDYDTALANALKKGNRSFKQVISSLHNNDLSPTAFMAQYDEAPLMRRIWRSLRARGYKVEILKKVEYNDGRSFYEGVSDTDPYHTYTYTAKVSW